MESHRIIAGLNFLNMGRGDKIQKVSVVGRRGLGTGKLFFHCNKKKTENMSVDTDKLIKLVVGS